MKIAGSNDLFTGLTYQQRCDRCEAVDSEEAETLSTTLQNLNTYDPFADVYDDQIQDRLIYIRIQQRNGRKTLTTEQGLSSDYDSKKIMKACKNEFACKGTVAEHPECGEVIKLQGGQRENICKFI
ncbi:hypothetical protein QYM36_015954 [Artemia franciscana]|uniref:SUI1 domain-containing protein n=1 Tax=Artemia franciscana TaxID=6661 RepID=A0AA88H630_ARTSF|nr:hypothetical protein QYM36_015954 [Artemia franciscana]